MKLFLSLDETRHLKEYGSVEIIRDGMEIVVEGEPEYYTITVVNPYDDVVLAKEPAKKIEETPAPAKKEIIVNLTVFNMLKESLEEPLKYMAIDTSEEFCDYDEMPTFIDVKDCIGEMMDGYMYEDYFVDAFDKIAEHDGINIEERDSADYVWDKYSNEIEMLLSAAAKDAYSKISKKLNK